MKSALPLIVLTALAACSSGDAPSRNDEAEYAVRVPLVTGTPEPIAAPPAPEQPEEAEWRAGTDGVAEFGVEGSAPLLSLDCEEGAFGVSRIVITRHWPAPQGKAALLALVGNLRLRIPVDARPPERWEGSLEAEDERWRILEDRFSATLPGGGLIRLPASPLTRELLRDCRVRSADEPGGMPSDQAGDPADEMSAVDPDA